MLTIICLLGLVASTFLRQVVLGVLIALELLLLASVISLLQNQLILDESLGQVFVCMLITLAGAETSCGLALIVSYYQQMGTVSLEPNSTH